MLGWDTDQFPMDVKKTTLVMQSVVRQGGLAPGGLNFDCKVRRESNEVEDLFISHIGAIDSFARGLRNVAQIQAENILPALVEERYKSWSELDIGRKVEEGKATFEELEQWVFKHGEPTPQSGKQEKFESLFNSYV